MTLELGILAIQFLFILIGASLSVATFQMYLEARRERKERENR